MFKRKKSDDKIERTYWRKVDIDSYSGKSYSSRQKLLPAESWDDANLVGSRCDDDQHAPVLDLDFSADLVPSSTPGHYHLYLEKKMSWDDYKKLLKVMVEVGLIEKGWYASALGDGMTLVRREGIYKPYDDLKRELEEGKPLF